MSFQGWLPKAALWLKTLEIARDVAKKLIEARRCRERLDLN